MRPFYLTPITPIAASRRRRKIAQLTIIVVILGMLDVFMLSMIVFGRLFHD